MRIVPLFVFVSCFSVVPRGPPWFPVVSRQSPGCPEISRDSPNGWVTVLADPTGIFDLRVGGSGAA
eukprot:7534877-Lingulodinium_polyedra.AAC.1